VPQVNYNQLNRDFYRPKNVGYSWKRQDLDELSRTMKKEGFGIERIRKGDWAKIDFIRDGSFMVLEDTLVLKKRGKTEGFATPTKLIMFGKEKTPLQKKYPWFVTIREIAYCIGLFAITGIYWWLK
jgi:hypothetical protein